MAEIAPSSSLLVVAVVVHPLFFSLPCSLHAFHHGNRSPSPSSLFPFPTLPLRHSTVPCGSRIFSHTTFVPYATC